MAISFARSYDLRLHNSWEAYPYFTMISAFFKEITWASRKGRCYTLSSHICLDALCSTVYEFMIHSCKQFSVPFFFVDVQGRKTIVVVIALIYPSHSHLKDSVPSKKLGTSSLINFTL